MSESPRDLAGRAARRREFAQGLLFRVVLCAFFTVFAAGMGMAGAFPMQNVAVAVATLVLLGVANVAYWWIGAVRDFPISDFAIHQGVDIVVLTFFIHWTGGSEVPYVGLAYSVLVLIAAIGQSRAVALRLALIAAFCFTLLVVLEGTGAIDSYGSIWGYELSLRAEVTAVVVCDVFAIGLALVGGTLGDQLRFSNARLLEATTRVEAQNRDLERRVGERTEELARATQEIRDLVYIVTHDLKNVAVGATETARQLELRDGERVSDRGRVSIQHLLEDSRTLSRMLEDLLRVFRDSDTSHDELLWVDVGEVMEGVLRRLRYRIEERGIQVEVGELPRVFAEVAKIRHIFDNLMDNACKYAGHQEQARIEVGGEVRGGMVHFFVRDNGIGLDERQHERIFQIYHRAPDQCVDGVEPEGHGIGLAIVKRIVERYGGAIGVESEPGRGATFWVTLPQGGGSST